MKSLKKSLAAFLAVLMLVFSMPFTALAVEEKGNIHLTAYDCYTINTSATVFWGPYDETTYQPLTGTIKAGSFFVVSFTLTGTTTTINGTNLKGKYDTTKVGPATTVVERDRRGNITSCTLVANTANDGAEVIDSPVLTNVFVEGATSKVRDGNSKMQLNGNFLIATSILPGDQLSGKTDLVYGYDPVANSYPDVYTVDGSMLGAVLVEAKEDIQVDDLYNIFSFTEGDTSTFFLATPSGYRVPLTYGPLGGSDPTPTKDTYTYTFADGSTQTVETEAGVAPTAPDNTAPTEFAKDADAETHSRTAYKWVADGDKAFKEVSYKDTADCNFSETSAKVDPIHTATELKDGKEAVQTCEVCHATKGGEVIKAEHKWTITPVAATCTVQAHNHYVCACGAEKDADFTGELAAHEWDMQNPVSTTAGDCQTKGTATYKCKNCDAVSEPMEGAYGPHKLTAHEAVEAKCETAGNDAYWTCETCSKIFADADANTELAAIPTIEALGHSFTNYVNNGDATCQTNATETAKCDRCDKTDTREILNSTVAHQFTVAGATTPGTCTTKAETVMSCAFGCGETEIAYGEIDPNNHVSTHVDANSAVAPTRATAGKEADTVCDACDNVVKEGAVIPALGVNITVAGSSLGTAAINGKDIADATENVPYESAYTLVATPADNAEFIGWMVGNKIVSKEATYTTNAYADMTYAPAFAAKDSASFTVTFVDSYGNVTATIDSAELATLTALPEAPSFAGLTFLGWDLDLDGVKALTKATTVTAKYENDTAKMYTVSAPNATIFVDGKDCGSETQVTYNTLVTVKAEGATAWKVNGSTTPAAYGAEYAFYCGSNITVDMVNDDTVTAKPEVKAVSKDANGYKVTFLATRSVPTGYQLVESGFVYGKAMTAADLVLENVGKTAGEAGATVKQIVCNNKGADGQFALAYGVKNMDANACAAAYVIYKDGAKSVVIYSDAMIYEY